MGSASQHQGDPPRDCARTAGGFAGPWWDRFVPRAGVRAQLLAASLLWLVGLSFLLVRGVLFLASPGPFRFNLALIPLAALGIGIGVLKGRMVLLGYARAAVARIGGRGRACFFGFLAPRSWAFIAVMMGGGILLRHSFLAGSSWGRDLLSVLYIAVGTALLMGDLVFWRATLSRAALTRPVPDAA